MQTKRETEHLQMQEPQPTQLSIGVIGIGSVCQSMVHKILCRMGGRFP